ncbi:MAG TPA: GNAT family N-acetyltransferase [Ktedonobacterales bacterium]
MTMQREQPQIHVRLAVADDAYSIASVLHAAFAEYESVYTPEAFAATTPTSDRILARFDEGPVWVAVRDDTMVGTVAAVPRGDALYIRSMAVLPAARGWEIGALLFGRVERFAAAHGHTRLVLSTTPFLTRAIRLYERLGLRRSDGGPQELYGTPLFTMVKLLPPAE